VAEITQETVEEYLADIEQAVIADFGGDALEEVLKIARADMRPFVTNSQRTQEYLREKFGRNMTEITASTRREVSKALNEGIALGEDYSGLSKRLGSSFDHLSRSRRNTIATTEVGGAANFAIDEGYRQSGLVSKRRWVTTFLRSRDTHMELSGDERGMDEPFTVNSVDGLASAMYPGDFNVAAEDINCRCRTVAAKFTSKETTEDVTLRRDKETGELTRGGKPLTKMKQLDGITDQARGDWEAWKSYDSRRRKYERQMENAAEDMFDAWRRKAKKKLKQMTQT
jgi:hypothetical protein